MDFNIYKEQIDEAGNIGYIFDEIYSGELADLKIYLSVLDQEGYDHYAEVPYPGGVTLIKAGG
jgi:hypothetical protein